MGKEYPRNKLTVINLNSSNTKLHFSACCSLLLLNDMGWQGSAFTFTKGKYLKRALVSDEINQPM